MTDPAAARVHGIVSVVAIGWIVYALSLPLLDDALTGLLPGIWRCPYAALTARPCPLCGVTSDFRALLYGHQAAGTLNNRYSFPLFLLILIELAWRITVLTRLRIRRLHGSPAENSKVLLYADVLAHSLGAALLATVIAMNA
jgi:hypothetical protein